MRQIRHMRHIIMNTTTIRMTLRRVVSLLPPWGGLACPAKLQRRYACPHQEALLSVTVVVGTKCGHRVTVRHGCLTGKKVERGVGVLRYSRRRPPPGHLTIRYKTQAECDIPHVFAHPGYFSFSKLHFTRCHPHDFSRSDYLIGPLV